MSRFPSFVDPNHIPGSKEEAVKILEYQITLGLMWYQCYSGVSIDSMRAYRIIHGVVSTLVSDWNNEKYSNIFEYDTLAEMILGIQDAIIDSFSIKESFNEADTSEEKIITRVDIPDHKSHDFSRFMHSRNNSKRRREEKR